MMVLFIDGVIADVIDTDSPAEYAERGYVELKPEHDNVPDLRMLKPDFSTRTPEEMYELGAWERPAEREPEIEPEEPVPPSREQIEAMRLIAYADPVTGSDRYFSEATRLEAMGDTAGAATARAAGVARYDEIRAAYPYPAE